MVGSLLKRKNTAAERDILAAVEHMSGAGSTEFGEFEGYNEEENELAGPSALVEDGHGVQRKFGDDEAATRERLVATRVRVVFGDAKALNALGGDKGALPPPFTVMPALDLLEGSAPEVDAILGGDAAQYGQDDDSLPPTFGDDDASKPPVNVD